MSDSTTTQYELRFRSRADGSSYAFPCDPQGRVDLNQLSERARNDYFFARGLVGRFMTIPAVEPASMCR